MEEEFLHMVWSKQLYNIKELLSEEEEEIHVIDRGVHNENDGPDFLFAKIRVDDTVLAGSVEIHVKASDWIKHKHSKNTKYKNVILHVVWENDALIKDLNCPTLELKGRISKYYIDNYKELMKATKNLPCKYEVDSINQEWLNLYQGQIITERFDHKSQYIKENLPPIKLTRIYQWFLSVLGKPNNEYGFSELAKCLPYDILLKYRADKHKLEALLFGVSGLLMISKSNDVYINKLTRTYWYLKDLHKLNELSRKDWVFLKIRPNAFPTIRLALLADLFYKVSSLENFVLHSSHTYIKEILLGLETHNFWKTHYVFDKFSSRKIKKMGMSTVLKLWVNAIIPLKLIYTDSKTEVLNEAILFLKKHPSEKNRILKLMSRNGFDNKNAFQSQFNLHKYKYYCIPRKCLNCGIGLKIIRKHD